MLSNRLQRISSSLFDSNNEQSARKRGRGLSERLVGWFSNAKPEKVDEEPVAQETQIVEEPVPEPVTKRRNRITISFENDIEENQNNTSLLSAHPDTISSPIKAKEWLGSQNSSFLSSYNAMNTSFSHQPGSVIKTQRITRRNPSKSMVGKRTVGSMLESLNNNMSFNANNTSFTNNNNNSFIFSPKRTIPLVSSLFTGAANRLTTKTEKTTRKFEPDFSILEKQSPPLLAATINKEKQLTPKLSPIVTLSKEHPKLEPGIINNETGRSLFGEISTEQPKRSSLGNTLGDNKTAAPISTTSLFSQNVQKESFATGPAEKDNAPTPVFGATEKPTKSLFGQSEQVNSNLFGTESVPTSISGNNNTTPTTSLFAQPEQKTTSLFGATETEKPVTSLFGTTDKPETSLLNVETTQKPVTSLFGTTDKPTESLFEKKSETTEKPVGSLFGTTEKPATSLFGTTEQKATSLFGATETVDKPTVSLFGNTDKPATSLFSQPEQKTTSLFGASEGTEKPTVSLFGTTTDKPGVSLFGAATGTTENPAISLFGSTDKPVVSLFGQTEQKPTSLFGQTETAPTPVFGGMNASTSLFGQTEQKGVSLFGKVEPAPASLFGGINSTTPTTSLFSQPEQKTTSLFGATDNVSTAVFGGMNNAGTPNTLFGQPEQKGTSLFGKVDNAPPVFGSMNNVGGSTSLFAQPTTSNTSFGANNMFGMVNNNTNMFADPNAMQSNTASNNDNPFLAGGDEKRKKVRIKRK